MEGAETNLLSRTDDVMRDPEQKWQHEAHGSRTEQGGERHGKKIAGFAVSANRTCPSGGETRGDHGLKR